MKVSILDAQHTLFQGPVAGVILPAVGGQLSLMDYHEPAFVALTKGSIHLLPFSRRRSRRRIEQAGTMPNAELGPISITAGVARMQRNELIILVE